MGGGTDPRVAARLPNATPVRSTLDGVFLWGERRVWMWVTPTPPSGRCSAPRSPLSVTSLSLTSLTSLAHSLAALVLPRQAFAFVATQEALLIAGPLVLPLVALYASKERSGIDARWVLTRCSSHPSVIPPFLTPRSFDPQVFPAAGGAAVREGGPAAGGAERRGDGRGDRGGCRRDEGCRGGESVHGGVVKGVVGGDLGGYCPR